MLSLSSLEHIDIVIFLKYVLKKVLMYDKRDDNGYPLERKTQIGKDIELITVKYHPKTEILQYSHFVCHQRAKPTLINRLLVKPMTIH